MMQNKTG